MHPYALAKHAYVHPTTLFPRGILAGPFGPVFEGPLSPMAASREQGNRRQVDSEEFARILTKQVGVVFCSGSYTLSAFSLPFQNVFSGAFTTMVWSLLCQRTKGLFNVTAEG